MKLVEFQFTNERLNLKVKISLSQIYETSEIEIGISFQEILLQVFYP